MANIPLFDAFNINRRLYADALSSRYITGQQWIPDVDLGLASDPDIYEKLRRDPVIAAAIDQLLFQVSSKPTRCEPADAENPADVAAARIMEKLLKHVHRFQEARYELSQAVILSSAFAEIQTERRNLRLGGPPQKWLVPIGLRDIDRRRWVLKSEVKKNLRGEDQLCTYWMLWDILLRDYRRVEHPEYFVKYIYADEESRLGYGRGLVEALVLYAKMKGRILQEGMSALERWAQGGVLIAKIDSTRTGSTDRATDDIVAAALAMWKSIRARHVAALGKEDDAELLEPSGTGHQMLMSMLDYVDQSIAKLILGATAPMGAGKGDKFRDQAGVEQDSTDLRVRFVREGLDEALTQDLLGLIWRANRANFHRLGLGEAEMPRLTSAPEPRPDPEQAARIVSVLGGMMPFKRDEIYHRLGLSVPMPGEPTIGGPGSMPQNPDGRLRVEDLQGQDFQEIKVEQFHGTESRDDDGRSAERGDEDRGRGDRGGPAGR